MLHEHPAVAEVAVIGMPHAELGEEVGAAVALKPGASATPEELRAFARDGWRRTSTRGRSGWWTRCPRARPARSCAARCSPRRIWVTSNSVRPQDENASRPAGESARVTPPTRPASWMPARWICRCPTRRSA